MNGNFGTVAQLLFTIKRKVGLPNFLFREIKSNGKDELLFGKNDWITFPSEDIPSIAGITWIPDKHGAHIVYKINTATSNSSGDSTSDADDVRMEAFFSNDSEIVPIAKKRRDSAFGSMMSELKLVDENKSKRAAIILNKNFNSKTVSNSEETNILHISDEPQGLHVTRLLYDLQEPTKNWLDKVFQNLEWTYYISWLRL